jgi:hypothetical protein
VRSAQTSFEGYLGRFNCPISEVFVPEAELKKHLDAIRKLTGI